MQQNTNSAASIEVVLPAQINDLNLQAIFDRLQASFMQAQALKVVVDASQVEMIDQLGLQMLAWFKISQRYGDRLDFKDAEHIREIGEQFGFKDIFEDAPGSVLRICSG